VNFVGGGGKTALIYKLMAEYCSEGSILYTTTTRIHPPDPIEGIAVVSSANISMLKAIVNQIGQSRGQQQQKIAITGAFMSTTLLRGVPTDFFGEIDRCPFPILLNEADGAAGFSLKMPNEHEPVLMESAEYMVPVIGIDCLDKTLGPETVFRWKSVAGSFPFYEGQKITPQLASDVLMHPDGVCRHWKPGVKIIPFINKVDTPLQDEVALELANAIRLNGKFPIERIVYGSVIERRVFS
jgi:probable selenium-dependent hydroxylase accessory protein YqeC